MENLSNATSGILWYDIREKYLDDRIYPSQKMSIVEDFRFRLFSQDKKYFPIKLIRSIFTNAVRVSNSYVDISNENVRLLKDKLDNAIDYCVDRIKVYVDDSGRLDGDNTILRSQGRIWGYPLIAIKRLGFRQITGEILVELYRPGDNVRQIYSPDKILSSWEKISGVYELSQLALQFNPSKDAILCHNRQDLLTLKRVVDMGIQIDDLNLNSHRMHAELWRTLFPLLENLLHDTLVMLSQYNACVRLR